MNVFYLDPDPEICAQMHIDKHVVKMTLEYGQLLSTAHRLLDGHQWHDTTPRGRIIRRWYMDDPMMESTLYLAAHWNHPSAKWARVNEENYKWLYRLFVCVAKEYTYRYGKVHKTARVLEDILESPPANIEKGSFFEPYPAMAQYPHCIVENDSITSYRNFYYEDKKDFSVWTKREKPFWWSQYETD